MCLWPSVPDMRCRAFRDDTTRQAHRARGTFICALVPPVTDACISGRRIATDARGTQACRLFELHRKFMELPMPFTTRRSTSYCLLTLAVCATLSAASAQDFPAGCWKLPADDGGSINAISKCKGDRLCIAVATAAANGQRPNNGDVGRCIVNAAAKTGDVWKGQIYIFAFDVDAEMELKRKGSSAVSVSGCYGPICSSRDWQKVACPGQRPANPATCK